MNRADSGRGGGRRAVETHWTLLGRFTWRHWVQAPRRSLLLVLILALGIGVYVSVRLANRAAVSSFRNFTDLVTQTSDCLITAPSGTLPESVMGEIRSALEGAPVHLIPVVETTGARARVGEVIEIGSQETFQLLGLDLVGLQNLVAEQASGRRWFGASATDGAESGATAFWGLLGNARAVFISEALAKRDGHEAGSILPLVIGDGVVPLEVVGTIPELSGQPSAPAQLLVMNLTALQRLTGKVGHLDRLEFVVEPGVGARRARADLIERLTEMAGDRWLLSTPQEREAAAAMMTRAFRLNLTLLSLIALLVGVYLIVQALDGAVVRRREEIAVLRSLGVEERTIRRAWLLEAGVIGLVGGALGAWLGWVGAQFSVVLVARTVNALYHTVHAREATLAPGELLAAMGLALVVSLGAGWMPARMAARTPPAQVLARHPAGVPGVDRAWSIWWGGGLVLVGLGLAWMPPVSLAGGGRLAVAGSLAALCWIFGGGILAGYGLLWVGRLARFPGARWPMLRLAGGHLHPPSGRHRLAVAGLVCAVAMTAGMAILVASFERTMRDWIERSFVGDLYLSSAGAQSASTDNRIASATWRQILAHPAVAEYNLVQTADLRLEGIQTLLAGGDLDFMDRHMKTSWVQAPRDDAVFDSERGADFALVSESFSHRFRRWRGDTLDVPTPAGVQRLEIAGVFADYGNERGSILVDRRQFRRWIGHEQATSLVVKLAPGHSVEAVRAEWMREHPGLAVYTNRHLRSEVLRIFRQTFSLTYALEVIGVTVAVLGLGLTLASVLIERRAELTTLRALGVRRNELAAATTWEGVLVGFSGAASGLFLSLALGWLLIFVINKQTFGWTLGFVVPWSQLALLLLLVLGCGALVAWAVGRWGANLPADREE
jgi:putative ABC transport system permease protein